MNDEHNRQDGMRTIVEPEVAVEERESPMPEPAYEPEPGLRRGVIELSRPLFFALTGIATVAVLALGAAVIVLAMDRGQSDPVVAKVNGETIRRSEYDRAVAAESGENVLDGLIVERLVNREAQRRDITLDDAEAANLVADQRKNFSDDQQFQAALARAGLTEGELAKQLRLNEMLKRMVSDQTQVSDDEVTAQYNANAAQFGGQPLEQVRDQVRTSIQRQKENTAMRALVDQLRAEAKIETFLPGKTS